MPRKGPRPLGQVRFGTSLNVPEFRPNRRGSAASDSGIKENDEEPNLEQRRVSCVPQLGQHSTNQEHFENTRSGSNRLSSHPEILSESSDNDKNKSPFASNKSINSDHRHAPHEATGLWSNGVNDSSFNDDPRNMRNFPPICGKSTGNKSTGAPTPAMAKDVSSVHKQMENNEHLLRSKIKDLEGEILEFKLVLSQRDHQITELTDKIQLVTIQFDKYKPLYTSEVDAHSLTKQKLADIQKRYDELEAKYTEMEESHEAKLRELVRKYEAKLIDLNSDKDKLIAELEAKIGRMKRQMAESFDGKAWERQHQIDELTREMKKVQEENESQKNQLKTFALNEKKRQHDLHQTALAVSAESSGKSVSKSNCSECLRLRNLLIEVSSVLNDKQTVVSGLKAKVTDIEKLAASSSSGNKKRLP